MPDELNPDVLEPESGAPDAGGAPAAGEVPSSVLVGALRERGYELPDTLDDDALVQQFETWADRAQRFPEDVDPDEFVQHAQFGREYAQHRAEFEQWRASRAQQQPETQPSAPSQGPQGMAGGAAGAPAPTQRDQEQVAKKSGYDPVAVADARAACTFNSQTQMWEPKQPFYAEAAKFLNDLARRAQRTVEEFGVDPDGFVRSRAEQLVEERTRQLIEERFGQIEPQLQAWQDFQRQQTEQQFLAPFKDQIYAPDGSFTPQGQVFNQAYIEAPEGLSVVQRLQWAKDRTAEWAASQQAQQAAKPAGLAGLFKKAAPPPAAPPAQQGAATPATPPETPESKRQKFVDSGRHQPRDESGRFLPLDRSGVVEASRNGHAPHRSESFRAIYERMKQEQ